MLSDLESELAMQARSAATAARRYGIAVNNCMVYDSTTCGNTNGLGTYKDRVSGTRSTHSAAARRANPFVDLMRRDVDCKSAPEICRPLYPILTS